MRTLLHLLVFVTLASSRGKDVTKDAWRSDEVLLEASRPDDDITLQELAGVVDQLVGRLTAMETVLKRIQVHCTVISMWFDWIFYALSFSPCSAEINDPNLVKKHTRNSVQHCQ